MTGLRCQHCQAEVTADLFICAACGGNVGGGSLATATVASTASAEAPMPADEVVCPVCAATNDRRERSFCGSCLAPLPVLAGPPPALRPAAAPWPPARLVFEIGIELDLEPGTEIGLGRDPAFSPVAASLAQFDTVSRRHATVGRDRGGAAWVREEKASNVTLVNGRPVPRETTVALRDGDELRLSTVVPARLHIG